MTQPHVLTAPDALAPPRAGRGGRASPSAIGNRQGEPRVQSVSLASMRDFAAAWQRLAERTLEPNVFYEPAFALAAAEVFGRNAGAVLVWSGRHPSCLIGFFPLRIETRRFGVGPSILTGWSHPYAPLGVPLVDREEAGDAIMAWLDFITTGPEFPRVALLPYVPVRGPFVEALRAALAMRGGRFARFGRHARAMLSPQARRIAYLRTSISTKKRKELARQRRKLAERGPVTFDAAVLTDDISAALDTFMRLEQRGWKGAAGTAAADDPAVHRFMQDAVAGLAARAQARILCMRSGKRAVAAGILLRSGANAWFWKTAYDEVDARASPGVQLTLALTQTCLADPSIIDVDSCATPDHPMIDHLWRERLELADLLIAPNRSAIRAFALAAALEHARRAIIGAAKWTRRLRG